MTSGPPRARGECVTPYPSSGVGSDNCRRVSWSEGFYVTLKLLRRIFPHDTLTG